MNGTISAGGQISRIVRGIPDEGKFSIIDNSYNTSPRKGFYVYGSYANNDGENDTQSDIYFIVINGASYKFVFDANRKVHFMPEADIDVKVTWSPVGSVSSSVGKFSNWVVTMPDGMKYFFSGTFTESSIEIEANEAQSNLNPTETNFYKYRDAESVVSGWYLTKISTTFGHNTIFNYFNNEYSFFRLADQEATTINCTFNGIPKKINKVFVRSSALVSITNSIYKVEFNKGFWVEDVDNEGNPIWYLSSSIPNRQDIDTYAKNPANSSNAKILKSVTVSTLDDPTKTIEWSFDYEYYTAPDYNGIPPFGYTYATVGYTHQKRLKLRTITEPDGNKYRIKYYDDGYTLPNRFSMGFDHWGYLNGALGAVTLIGEDAFRVCTSGQYANRTASVGWSQYGTISSISHTTGGTTFFEYDNHHARNYLLMVGGSRIRKITYTDSVSNLRTVKIYDYLQKNGSSSGFLCLKPVYHFDDKINYTGAADQYWNSGLYQQLLSESGRPAVGYSRVKETILSGNSTVVDTLGSTVSEFDQPLTEINITQTVTYNCVTTFPPSGPPVTTCDTSKYIRPWLWHPFHENNIGIPLTVSVYGKNGQVLSQKNNQYAEEYLPNPQSQFRTFRMVGQNYNFLSGYSESFTTYRLRSDTTKTFSQDGTNPIITVNNQDYKSDMPTAYQQTYKGKHNQVCKTTTTDSYGFVMENIIKYVADFDFGKDSVCIETDEFGTCLAYNYTQHEPTDAEAKGIFNLQERHIINAVVESTTKKIGVGNNAFYTSAMYQTYYGDSTSNHKKGLPKSSYVAENMP